MYIPQASSTSVRTVVVQLSVAMITTMIPDCLPSTKERAPNPAWVILADSSALMACGAVGS